MNVPEIPEISIDVEYERIKTNAEKNGYRLNPDIDFVKNLIRGLLKNEQRYGYRACPCRLASGIKDQDLDIICPCDYRDTDVEEHGACYCALYVNELIATGKQNVAPVPERRPPRSERRKALVVKTVSTTTRPVFPLPVWRCKVCGYLCAREQPPGICPICKATKERFERFV
ncbi:ferredoxin-thioredoxin reductase catalytic domain-containing protein [Methanoregula sp.]|jgi:ferredoxin-thioredoxin reductase catalytic subunit|uniref:ferredoxin-thioredoxin reductase catalytic domain-containing protein n=1 Tax=Methanoregula sp. TaxID=2052170 RepID=UPI003565194B